MNANPNEFAKNFKYANFERLNNNLKPDYYNLFTSLSRVNDGVETLVQLRENLLNILEDKSE